MKSDWRDSKNLEINEVENGSVIIQKASLWAQAVCKNNLQNELMYEITC